MLVELDVFLFVVQIDWLESFWKWDDLVHEFFYWATVWFADGDLVKDETEFVLCSEGCSCWAYLVVTYSENHSVFFNFVSFSDNFWKLIGGFVELLSRDERFEDCSSFGEVAERGSNVWIWDVIYSLDNCRGRSEWQLELEFDLFPLIRSPLEQWAFG